MAEEKLTITQIDDAKATLAKAAATNVPASALSLQTAAKMEEKVESWWSLLTTPTGRVTLGAIVLFIGSLVAQFMGSLPSVRVEITNWPAMQIEQGKLTPPGPVVPQVPTSAKVGIITFSKGSPTIVTDTTLWKWYADRGHVVQHLTAGSPEAHSWKAYSDKAGYEQCVVVVDASLSSDNYLGSYALTDRTSVEKNIRAHIGK